MITFFIAVAILLAGYFIYGKWMEKVFGAQSGILSIIIDEFYYFSPRFVLWK